jgi:prepilin signal peptidase PulO-like enzyme (type II secretory pathway)
MFEVGLFLLGLIVGSFLNVVISTLGGERKNVLGRSECDHCERTLKWYELIPLFSFLWARGLSLCCKKKISWQYPLVELATGLLFVFWASSVFDFVFLSVLLVILVYDWKKMLVPDVIVLPAILLAAVLNFSNWPAFGIAAGFFALLVVVSRERWMGWGDVEIAALMGFLLGFPDILLALLLAFVIGAIYGIILICLKGKKLKSEIPFGPFLVIGTLILMHGGLSLWLKSLLL